MYHVDHVYAMKNVSMAITSQLVYLPWPFGNVHFVIVVNFAGSFGQKFKARILHVLVFLFRRSCIMHIVFAKKMSQFCLYLMLMYLDENVNIHKIFVILLIHTQCILFSSLYNKTKIAQKSKWIRAGELHFNLFAFVFTNYYMTSIT